MFVGADGTLDITSMANLASMAIWGMVLAKARSGLEAVETQDSSKVGGLLSKVTSLIVLIAVSAICKMVALTTTPQPVSVPAVEVAHNTPLLKQSRQEEQYPESYYDESSSHYLGGAHNVALKQLKTANTSKAYTRKDGAHNVALDQVRAESRARVQQSNLSYLQMLGSIYKAQSSQKLT